MLLSDRDIKQAIENKEITIENFDLKRLQPASYDLLLGNKFMLPEPERDQFVDPHNKIFPHMRHFVVGDDDKFVLHPRITVLGTSWDFFGSDKYLIQLSGKSSLARIGLIVHNTAGIINPGHYLNITLELFNLSNVPIILRPRMEIAQITFSKLTSDPEQNYKNTGRYSSDNWKGGTAPKREERSEG
ncbi:MAG: dCTP deaminase [Candidatus Paceibacterota bacterium]